LGLVSLLREVGEKDSPPHANRSKERPPGGAKAKSLLLKQLELKDRYVSSTKLCKSNKGNVMRTHRIGWAKRTGAIVGLVMSCAFASAAPNTKHLTGTVTNASHHPLSGAYVKVQNRRLRSIQSYITRKNGRYSFRRLNGETDYEVWATYRRTNSSHKELSRFDSNISLFIDLAVDLQ